LLITKFVNRPRNWTIKNASYLKVFDWYKFYFNINMFKFRSNYRGGTNFGIVKPGLFSLTKIKMKSRTHLIWLFWSVGKSHLGHACRVYHPPTTDFNVLALHRGIESLIFHSKMSFFYLDMKNRYLCNSLFHLYAWSYSLNL
jgi:hypothetical protein